MKIAFVERKRPDLDRVGTWLNLSDDANHWANRGPVYRLYQERVASYMTLPEGCGVVPLSNGGVALEVMARLHARRAGRKLRWIASAYSFLNLGRGYFADVRFVDCDSGGRLDLDAVRALDPDSFDGLIVTNPFGLYVDYSDYAGFACETGKPVLMDNAPGVFSQIPDLPWQAFSLHHTKPFGMGEGGLAVVPKEDEEEIYGLVNYATELTDDERPHWFQNGKLSDISAAMLLDRLEKAADWAAPNLAQRERVIGLAAEAGLTPLALPETPIPMTSMPFLSERPIPIETVNAARHATCAKYYLPLASLPEVTRIYRHLVNVPCHADMAELSDAQIAEDLALFAGVSARPGPQLRSLTHGAPGRSDLPRAPLSAEARARPADAPAYGAYRDAAAPLRRF